MNLTATPLSWNACLSALRLDRWMMGELAAEEAESIGNHVSGCATCSAAVAGMRGVREEVRALPLPPPLSRPAPRRWSPRVAAAGVTLALAASVLLVLRPDTSGTSPAPGGRLRSVADAPPDQAQRRKGAGLALSMYVQHGGEVRRAGPGESVAPGDAVRFAVSTPTPAFVAVLSLDPAGKASVYFPEGARAAQIAAGTEIPLPLGTRLDASTGEERLLGLFCTAPVELEPIRLALQQHQEGAALPSSCQGLRWSFVKR
jgi:Domain of unknown function (DUF4384)